jgi:hypothetical protein
MRETTDGTDAALEAAEQLAGSARELHQIISRFKY